MKNNFKFDIGFGDNKEVIALKNKLNELAIENNLMKDQIKVLDGKIKRQTPYTPSLEWVYTDTFNN